MPTPQDTIRNRPAPSPDKWTEKRIDVLMTEWKEVRESLRYFGNKRFAQLTVFIAANGFMVNAYFGKDNPMPGLWGGIFGAVLAIVFLMLERSSMAFVKRFAARGREIEKDLKLVQMIQRRPRWDFGTGATYGLYLFTLFVWLVIGYHDLVGVRPQSIHPKWAGDLWQKITGQPPPQPAPSAPPLPNP